MITVGYNIVWNGIHKYGITYLFHDRRASANMGLRLAQ